ncbi:MAG: DUF1801 domain-containing protein [Burkholderiales bacterium]|nr:DUF1801 domain-containing protein [Burkholderiales bacterium]
MTPFEKPEVAAVFQRCPPAIRSRLLALRELIFDFAASTPGVGRIEETLKWGEPAYVTAASRSGSTIRVAWKKTAPSQYAMYFHCQTNLVSIFRTLFPMDFEFVGNRALVFEASRPPPVDALTVCIAAALTYHLDKRSGSRTQAAAKPASD